MNYDSIGGNYSTYRKPDKSISSIINEELKDAKTIINIGAGAGSYEPKGRNVIAVEPSEIMISQRPKDSAPVIKSFAENLPFADKEFDLALAILTIHHWSDKIKGLKEMKRVSGRQLIFTWNPLHSGFWLTKYYFPEILAIDKSIFPQFKAIEKILGTLDKKPVPIPRNCTDGFGCAYWSRPQAYLSSEVRAAISTFNKISNVEKGIAKLRQDIDSGEWESRHGYLRNLPSLDLGYTLLYSKE